jgi:NADPH:quinone reductase-like Zn-dependent oxidoreductase
MGRLVSYGSHSLFPKIGGRPNPLALIWKYFRTPRFNPIRMAEHNRSVMAFNLSFLFGRKELLRESMQQIMAWLDARAIRPSDVMCFDFEAVADAHRAIESGRLIGRIALTVRGS